MKRARTTTFLLELPLVVTARQAKHLRAHLETARCLYNALLGEARTRLRRMRADPAWQAAAWHSLARSKQPARAPLRTCASAMASANMPCTPTPNRLVVPGLPTTSIPRWLKCWPVARITRSIGSARARRAQCASRAVDGGWTVWKANAMTPGMRFVLQAPEQGNQGLSPLGNGSDPRPSWIVNDPVVAHGLRQRIKYVRLVRRKASSPRAKGADGTGHRYSVQLILEGRAVPEAQASAWSGHRRP